MNVITKLFKSYDDSLDPAMPESSMQAVLDALASLGGKPVENLTAEEARKQPTPTDAVKRVLAGKGKQPTDDLGVTTHDIMIPGAAGDLPARVYRPEGTENEKLPVVIYWHGGGWVIANIDVYDGGARALSKIARAVVISCHYRQAPEHKFPAAHEDAFSQYKWVRGNTGVFSGDAAQIAVAGESAGANLAIGVAIAARDTGIDAPRHMVLVYPVAGNDMNTPSYKQNANAKPLNKPMMKWFVEQTFNSKAETADPRINLVASDLSRLPSATIILAEIDPLRSEGEQLAKRLEEAGSEVDYKIYDGMTHEFFGMGVVVGDAMSAEKFAAGGLKKAFGTDTLL